MLQATEGVQLQRAGGLYKAVLAIMLAYVLTMLAAGQGGARLAAPLFVMVVGAGAVWLQQRNQQRAAVLVFVWGVWAVVTVQGVLRSGVGNPALFTYPALMLLGGWVLGMRQGVLLGTASIGASLLLALAEHYGLIVGRTLETPPIWYWLPIAIVMLASMTAMHFILKVHWSALQTTRELNQELELVVATLTTREQALQRSERRFHVISESNPLPIS